jgi:hypothetical protein
MHSNVLDPFDQGNLDHYLDYLTGQATKLNDTSVLESFLYRIKEIRSLKNYNTGVKESESLAAELSALINYQEKRMETTIVSQEKEKYKRIIENTIIESNRVLKSWANSDMKGVTFDNYRSLINGYLVKFIKHEFNYRAVFNVSKFSPLFEIKDNRISSISFTPIEKSYHSCDRQLLGLVEYVKTYDFEGFDKIQKLNSVLEQQTEKPQYTELASVNFDTIMNIKFN